MFAFFIDYLNVLLKFLNNSSNQPCKQRSNPSVHLLDGIGLVKLGLYAIQGFQC